MILEDIFKIKRDFCNIIFGKTHNPEKVLTGIVTNTMPMAENVDNSTWKSIPARVSGDFTYNLRNYPAVFSSAAGIYYIQNHVIRSAAFPYLAQSV